MVPPVIGLNEKLLAANNLLCAPSHNRIVHSRMRNCSLLRIGETHPMTNWTIRTLSLFYVLLPKTDKCNNNFNQENNT